MFGPPSRPRARHAGFLAIVLVLGACSGGPPDTLGPRNGGLAPCPATPNCVHTGLRHPRGTKGFFVRGAVLRSEIIPRIADIVGSMERTTVVTETETEEYLHAEVRSGIFRFVADLEFFLLPNQELIVRSASRVGKNDGGKNAARVEEIRRRLTEAGLLR